MITQGANVETLTFVLGIFVGMLCGIIGYAAIYFISYMREARRIVERDHARIITIEQNKKENQLD